MCYLFCFYVYICIDGLHQDKINRGERSWKDSTNLESEYHLESQLSHWKLCDLDQLSWPVIISISSCVKWRELLYLLIHRVLKKMK